MEEKIKLNISKDEAIVLFEWLAKFNENIHGYEIHPAEQQVLYNIECILEKELSEPFQPDYNEIVKQAMQRIMNPIPDPPL